MSTKILSEFDTPEPRFHGEVTEKSHKNMSRIRGKDTSIEVKLRKALWHKGIRYRKNYKKIPGRPDIAITKYKIAVFVDGEFWHGYDWENRKGKLKSNRDYWIEKIEENIARDKRNDKLLQESGWITIHFWEKEVNKDLKRCKEEVLESLKRRKEEVSNAENL